MRTHPELAALSAQARVLEGLLDELEPQDWVRPSRCSDWLVRDLVAHLAWATERYVAALRGKGAKKANRDRVSWWGYDADELGPRISAGTKEQSASRSDEELEAWLRSVLTEAEEATQEVPPEAVVSWKGRQEATALVADVAATRVLELGVHGMDIGHATLRGERLDPKAAEVIVGILDGLLDAPLPKAIGWTPRTYILTATGRRPMEPNERFVLGELADRFPLIR